MHIHKALMAVAIVALLAGCSASQGSTAGAGDSAPSAQASSDCATHYPDRQFYCDSKAEADFLGDVVERDGLSDTALVKQAWGVCRVLDLSNVTGQEVLNALINDGYRISNIVLAVDHMCPWHKSKIT